MHVRLTSGLPVIAGAVVSLLGIAPRAHAQITSQNSDQHTIINARGAALGDSYVSEDYDVSTMYWNPAGLSFLQRESVVASYAIEQINDNGNLMTENVAVPVPRIGAWTAGIGITVHHIGKLDPGSPIAGSDFMILGSDVAVARAVTRSWSLGATVTVRNGRLGSVNRWAVNSTVGMFYQPDPGISYGMAFQGAGDAIQFPYETSTLPASVERVTPLHSLQVGLTMRFPSMAEREPYLTLTLANQKIFGENKLTYKGGLEWYTVTVLALRIGYWIGPNTAAAKYGLGLRLARMQLDYAISPSKLEPRFHEFTLAIAY